MTGGDRRVRREHGLAGHPADGVVERIAVPLHPPADRLQRGEHGVPLVQMVDAGHDSHRADRPHAAHAEHELLPDPQPRVAAIEPAGQFAVLRIVHLDVGVEQEQVDAAHRHLPDFRENRAGPRVDLHGDRLAVGAEGRLDRQGLGSRLQVFLVLVAVDVELLLEVALVVEQAHRDQRDAQTAGTLDVVAREHAQAARVDRHRFMDAELGRKIDDRLRSQHAGVDVAPGRIAGHVFLEPAVGLIDPAVEHEFGGTGFQPLGCELRQQGDRVVVELPPADRVELPEEIGHFRMPAPPEVAGQGHALLVELLRRKLIEPRRGMQAAVPDRGRGTSGCTGGAGLFGLAHDVAPDVMWRWWGNLPEGSAV